MVAWLIRYGAGAECSESRQAAKGLYAGHSRACFMRIQHGASERVVTEAHECYSFGTANEGAKA